MMYGKTKLNSSIAAATVKKECAGGETAGTENSALSALKEGVARSESQNTQDSTLQRTEPESTHGDRFFNTDESARHSHCAGSDKTSQTPDNSFLDLVRQTVSKKGDAVFATWYGSQGKATNEYTYGRLWEEAGVISHYLRNEWDLKKGDRVVLCYNLGLHFFVGVYELE